MWILEAYIWSDHNNDNLSYLLQDNPHYQLWLSQCDDPSIVYGVKKWQLGTKPTKYCFGKSEGKLTESVGGFLVVETLLYHIMADID